MFAVPHMLCIYLCYRLKVPMCFGHTFVILRLVCFVNEEGWSLVCDCGIS